MLVIWIVGLYPGFLSGTHSATEWLFTAWNRENDYEHGWMVPLLSIYMLIHACRGLRGMPLRGSLHGLWMTLAGALLCVLAVRIQQGRVAIGALPFLLSGGVWCYCGGRAALSCAFPFFFL
jgi:hypothetical protein